MIQNEKAIKREHLEIGKKKKKSFWKLKMNKQKILKLKIKAGV